MTDPSGTHLAVSRSPGISETINRNGTTFSVFAQFTVTQGGEYEISTTSAQPTAGPVVVTREFVDLVRELAPWLIVASVDALVLFVAAVVFLVSLLRRPSRRVPPPAFGPSP